MFKLYSFNRRHKDAITDAKIDEWKLANGGRDHQADAGKKLTNMLRHQRAFWCYYFEHGRCLWGLTNDSAPAGVEFQWDGVRFAGLLVWEGKASDLPTGYEERRQMARDVLADITMEYNGDDCEPDEYEQLLLENGQ